MQPTILIVDDVPEQLGMLKMYIELRHRDWTVLTAPSVTVALSVLDERLRRSRPVDVVVSDLLMDGGPDDGMTLIAKARERDPSVMTILYTAHAEHLQRYRAFELGAFDVILKTGLEDDGAREIVIKSETACRLRERARQVDSLSCYFDAAVVERLLRDPAILAMKSRLITIAFWDVRGFTALCDQLRAAPELVAGFLNEYCDMGARTIKEQGGVLDKFIGDGIMGLFGVLNPNASRDDGEADALAAVHAALNLKQRFDPIAERWMAKWKRHVAGKISVGLGCGLHTGLALAGDIGAGQRHHFTAVGDAVNTAARIQDCARDTAILLSQSTRERVGSYFRTTLHGEYQVKGVSAPLPLFRID